MWHRDGFAVKGRIREIVVRGWENSWEILRFWDDGIKKSSGECKNKVLKYIESEGDK